MSKLICETCGQYEHQGECDMPNQAQVSAPEVEYGKLQERIKELEEQLNSTRLQINGTESIELFMNGEKTVFVKVEDAILKKRHRHYYLRWNHICSAYMALKNYLSGQPNSKR